VNLNYHQKKKN